MIDHISFSVNNFKESRNFYDKTLPLLGYEIAMDHETNEYQFTGYGKNKKPSFWISFDKKSPRDDEQIGKAKGFHVAFIANSTESIDKWYAKCLELGGKDNGKPGPRPEYHPGYYGAFVVDPNGWRLEACFHGYKK